MKTILRQHIPYGIALAVYPNRQEAILHLIDPHATLHKVPDNLCRKGNTKSLLLLVKAQIDLGFFFDVFAALQRAREKIKDEDT